MKPVIRLFFKALRIILGPFLLLGYWLTQPKGIARPEAAQRAIDSRTQHLALYHFPTCPFCLKSRRVIRRLSLNIKLCDARNNPSDRAELIAGGGKPQVPCLRTPHSLVGRRPPCVLASLADWPQRIGHGPQKWSTACQQKRKSTRSIPWWTAFLPPTKNQRNFYAS